jgi:glycosyltransferase involved in cell wall biosynthesis
VRVVQFVPTLLAHDAVGNIVRRLDAYLHNHGVEAQVAVAGHRPPPGALTIERLRLDDHDLVLYHLASRSPEGARLAARHPNVVVHYHNITPAELMLPWLPAEAIELAMARREAVTIVERARLVTAVSRYNADDLATNLGCGDAVVTGTLSEHGTLRSLPPSPWRARLGDDWDARGRPHDWLSVGRLTPHKRQDDVIAAFAAYRAASGEDARLRLVGRPANRRWLTYLRSLAADLGIAHRVQILVRAVPSNVLADLYRTAGVYVSASRHEGFGLPFLEAMSMEVPIAALARAAVTETVADAGVLVDEERPAELAAAAWAAASSRSTLAPCMQARLAAFDNERIASHILELLRSLA